MKKHSFTVLSLLTLLSLFLAACAGAPATPTLEPGSEEAFNPLVSATGVIVPAQWATLAMPTGGLLAEVPVQEGQSVTAGQVLVRLAGSEKLEAAVQAANVQLLAAQQELETLNDNAEQARTAAQLRLANAQKALDDAKKRRAWKQYRNGSESSIDTARADLIMARNNLDDAKDTFKSVSDRAEDDVDRAAALSALGAARNAYDHALANLNYLLALPNKIDVDQAQAVLEAAQAEVAAAQAELDKLQNGPDPDDLALVKQNIKNAQAQLVASQSALADLELKAPFDGTVSQIEIHVGEWVSPGTPVMLLANMASLRVETTDLNEIDAARVSLNDPVKVTFDALPSVELGGQVTRISLKSDEGSGVNYTVVVELKDPPANLRWGMTAFVDIEVFE